MYRMADPMDTLRGIQIQIDDGYPIDSYDAATGYMVIHDKRSNTWERYLYIKIVNKEVQALSIFALEDPIYGLTCYSVGYAVKENYRRRGFAIEAINKGIEDLKNRFRPSKLEHFYVDALIDEENIPSIRLAEKLFPGPAVRMPDQETGTPALHFKKLITLGN